MKFPINESNLEKARILVDRLRQLSSEAREQLLLAMIGGFLTDNFDSDEQIFTYLDLLEESCKEVQSDESSV